MKSNPNINKFKNIDKISEEERIDLLLEYEYLTNERLQQKIEVYQMLIETGQTVSKNWLTDNIVNSDGNNIKSIQDKIDKILLERRERKIDNIIDED